MISRSILLVAFGAFLLLLALSILEYVIRTQLRASRSGISRVGLTDIDPVYEDDLNNLMTLSEERTPGPRYWQEKRLTFRSKSINLVDGFRVTTDMPPVRAKTIHMYGGSTTLCIEVPDDKTISSYLQREIRIAGRPYSVFNRGVSGATVHGNLNYLVQDEICSGDIVIVYFGINDAKVTSYPRCGRGLFSVLPLWVPLIHAVKKFTRLMLLEWLWYQTVTLDVVKLEKFAAKRSRLAEECMSEIRSRVEMSGASLIAVLKPHIWSKRQTSREKSRASQVDRNIPKVLEVTYKKFLSDFSKVSGFYTFVEVFNHVNNDTYVDWSHTNGVGNEILAKHFMSIIIESTSA